MIRPLHRRLILLLPLLALYACAQWPPSTNDDEATIASLRRKVAEQGSALDRARAQARQADARANAAERDLAAARRENAELKKQIEALGAIERSLSNRSQP